MQIAHLLASYSIPPFICGVQQNVVVCVGCGDVELVGAYSAWFAGVY